MAQGFSYFLLLSFSLYFMFKVTPFCEINVLALCLIVLFILTMVAENITVMKFNVGVYSSVIVLQFWSLLSRGPCYVRIHRSRLPINTNVNSNSNLICVNIVKIRIQGIILMYLFFSFALIYLLWTTQHLVCILWWKYCMYNIIYIKTHGTLFLQYCDTPS